MAEPREPQQEPGKLRNSRQAPEPVLHNWDWRFLVWMMAQPRDFSEHTAQLIDDEVRELIRSMEKRAYELLEANRHKLDALAEALLEHETLDADGIAGVLAEAQDAQTKPAQASG